MGATIYERLGREAGIDTAVDKFYEKVLADDRIKHFFAGVDMKRQAGMQKAFLIFAFGGPNNYSGRGLKAAHARMVEEMGLNDSHFDAVLENLGATLKELSVPDDLIAQAAAVAEGVRDDVLGR
ncbi:group 1 truncated hemoglobin [bacterium]|nr:group 1 truncated hemoglobin [bacterium]